MKHETDLVWYQDGKLYTQREMLEKQYGRRVSEDEAMEYVKKKQFVVSFIQHAQLRHETNKK